MMTVTDFLILLSFLVSAVLALASARSIINTALKTQLFCSMFLDDTNTAETDVYENEGFYLYVELQNPSVIPFPYLKLNLNLPDGLIFDKSSSGVLADVFSVPGKGSSKKRYWIRAIRRGAYVLDYAVIVRDNITGLDTVSFRMPVSVGRRNSLTVYPTILDLEEHFTTAMYTTGDIEVHRSPVADPLELIGIRPYANDPMKNINWKKTAAFGELMVNENGFTEDEELTILLNLQSRAYERYDTMTEGISSTDRTELAVSVAASIVDAVSVNEAPLHLIVNGNSDYFCDTEDIEEHSLTYSLPASSFADYHAIMRMLARIHGGVTMPAHLMLYKIAEEPERYLTGKNLIVVSPYFDSIMRDFYSSMESMGYAVVFYITSLFNDTTDIPDDIPLYYRTHRGTL